jgi:hypothetical protein
MNEYELNEIKHKSITEHKDILCLMDGVQLRLAKIITQTKLVQDNPILSPAQMLLYELIHHCTTTEELHIIRKVVIINPFLLEFKHDNTDIRICSTLELNGNIGSCVYVEFKCSSALELHKMLCTPSNIMLNNFICIVSPSDASAENLDTSS